MPEVTKERATSATISHRKCSHRPGNYRPTLLHTNGRGRAFLFPGLYLWGPPAPRCGGAQRHDIPEEARGEPLRLLLPMNGNQGAGSAARGSLQLDIWDWSCPPR